MSFLRLVFIVCCLGILVQISGAKEAPKPPPGFQPAPNLSAEIDNKLSVSREMIKHRNYEGAAALLETIYEKQPENMVVVNLLRDCYSQLGQFSKSELLVRRIIDQDPLNNRYRVYLAESLSRQGHHDDAAEAYRDAITSVIKNDSAQYLEIIRSMQTHGSEDNALRLIDSLRALLNNPRIFAFEAGSILEFQSQYKAATAEFLTAGADSSRIGAQAENKLLTLLRFEESSGEVEQALLEHLQIAPDAHAALILSSFYLDTDRDAKALVYVLLQDSLKGGQGVSLLQHMRTCRDRKLYSQTVEVGQFIISRYRDQPAFSEAYLVYADALVHLGQFDAAIAAYDSIIATFPRKQDKAEAGYRIGNIYLNYLYDYPAAMEIFDSVATHYRAGGGYLNTLLNIPHCYLRQGVLDSARTKFEELLNRRLNDEGQEEVQYYLALIRFFENNIDSCKAGFNKLLVDYPRGFYVNDALQLLVLINQATEAPKLLQQYARALLYEQQHRIDSTMLTLQIIVDDPDPVLADVALYKLSLLNLEQNDSTATIEYIDKMGEKFPESYYLPYGLKTKADMLLTDPQRLDEGREIYRHLLENYPNYPFISEVRKKLREMELDAHTG